MRECNIKIGNDGSVTVSKVNEYIGEHSATALVITLNNELKESDINYYTLSFKPGAALRNPPQSVLTSDMITADSTHATVKNGVLTYPLPSALTSFGSLDAQVNAHKLNENGELISTVKSPVFRITFDSSVTGNEELLFEDANGFTSLIHTALAQLNLTVEEADKLCDKINDAYENGELNGATIMPHIDESGTLSWTNDAGFENPAPINLMGPKGEKGDKGENGTKGDKGDKGDPANINGHPTIQIQSGKNITLEQDGNILTLNAECLPIYHELPSDAQTGDLCLYSPNCTITAEHSEKSIGFDWEKFCDTCNEDSTLEIIFLNGVFETGSIYSAVMFTDDLSYFEKALILTKGSEEWFINFINGEFDSSTSYYSVDGNRYILTQPLDYFELPKFKIVSIAAENIDGDIFYAPLIPMVCRGNWYELASGTKHTHSNHNTLESLYKDDCEKSILSPTLTSNYLSCGGAYLRYCSDGSVISKTETIQENDNSYLRLWLNNGPLDTGELPAFIDIPILSANEKETTNNGVTVNGTGLNLGIGDFSSMNKISAVSADINIIAPNTLYTFDEVETLTIELAEADQAKVNEYTFTFTSGATPTVLTLPDTVKWANELTIEANKRYEISIVDNIGLWCAVEVDV